MSSFIRAKTAPFPSAGNLSNAEKVKAEVLSNSGHSSKAKEVLPSKARPNSLFLLTDVNLPEIVPVTPPISSLTLLPDFSLREKKCFIPPGSKLALSTFFSASLSQATYFGITERLYPSILLSS